MTDKQDAVTLFAKLAALLSGLAHPAVTMSQAFAVAVFAGGVALFADLVPQPEAIFPWIEKAGSYAVLTWYLWYSTTRVQPALQASHEAHVEKMQTAHVAGMNQLATAFSAELQRTRDESDRWRQFFDRGQTAKV